MDTNFILVILIGFALFVAGYLWQEKKKSDFAPFRITIRPNWYELLKDHNLVNEESWKQLITDAEGASDEEYEIFKKGISFTVLNAGDIWNSFPGGSNLVFDNNWNLFSSRVDFEKRFGLKIKQDATPDRFLFFRGFQPCLAVKSGIDGYEIGIDTPESVISAGEGGNSIIKLATIPYSIFGIYGHKSNWGKIEKQLTKNGLLLVPKQSWRQNNSELVHKYFKVYYEFI